MPYFEMFMVIASNQTKMVTQPSCLKFKILNDGITDGNSHLSRTALPIVKIKLWSISGMRLTSK